MTNARIGILILLLLIGIGAWFLTYSAARLDEVAEGVVPLDPRDFEEFTLLTLGTASGNENHNRRGPATAFGIGTDVVLIEASRSAAESLRAGKIPVSQPSAVFVTSLLPENVVGLDDLLASAWIAGRREPIPLYGPAGLTNLARAAETTVTAGIAARARAFGNDATPLHYAVTEVHDGFEHSVGKLRVRTLALPGGPLEAFAYRVGSDAGDAVITGAGWAPEELTAFAQGAHWLVHEGAMIPTPEEAAELGLEEDPAFLRKEAAFYASIPRAAGIARRAGIPNLVFVRLRPPPVYDVQITSVAGETYDGKIHVADDGDEFTR